MTFQELMTDFGFKKDHCEAADYLTLPPKALLRLKMDHGEKILEALLSIAWAKSRALQEQAPPLVAPIVTGAGPSKVEMET